MAPIERIQPDGLFVNPAYTHVVVTERRRMIHISGQVAMDAAGTLVGEGDHGAQTEQVLRNLATALAAAGAGFADVIKLTTYVVGITPEIRAAVGAARTRCFGSEPPASTLIGVPALALPGWLVEIEAIAALD